MQDLLGDEMSGTTMIDSHGGDHHKSLVPLMGGEGSLQRLLRQLLLLAPDSKIYVVVSHRASDIEAASRALSSTVTCIGDSTPANSSPTDRCSPPWWRVSQPTAPPWRPDRPARGAHRAAADRSWLREPITQGSWRLPSTAAAFLRLSCGGSNPGPCPPVAGQLHPRPG